MPFLSFDANGPDGGGFWQVGHYANRFWAALLGAVAWRVYELVVSGDRRRQKTPWTPPHRYSISELARAAAGGRDGRPNRDQISGRYRRRAGQWLWQPGAFDRLVAEGVARIQWHAGDGSWRPWLSGGDEGRSRTPCPAGQRPTSLRLVYRISVVTDLPLLTPHQVARLAAEHQVAHERYLSDRGLDLSAWEQIPLPSLAARDGGELDH